MKLWRRLALLSCAAAIAGFAPAAEAQELETLRLQVETASGQRLSGALVALVDRNNRVLAESLSNSNGLLSLSAVAGEYRIRVRRVGYRPYYSTAVTLPRGLLVVKAESPRVELASMVVSAKAQCGRRNRDAAALAEVWEEIAKALQAKRLTQDDATTLGITGVYKHDLKADGSIEKADTTFFAESSVRPFAAIDASSLLRDGYVRGNITDGWEYFGPDEVVLLSDGFAETHCFSLLRQSARQGQLGLSFDPAPSRKKADIRGVLWIDEKTSELREVTFQFVNVDDIDRFDNGGFTKFRRMPSGSWIVEEWKLRMPKLKITAGMTNRIGVIGYVENGGMILGNSFR